jgi:sorbitol/mannitol transport system substrate-binding protein
MERATDLAGVEEGDDVLRRSAEEGRPSRSELERLQRKPDADVVRQVRDVDRRDGRGMLYNKQQSQIADKVGFAAAPIAVTPKGSHWLWAWALAIPKSSKQPDAAKKFIEWATSKEYIEMVAKDEGWASVPPGTRQSTYARPEYKQAAPFGDFVLKAIQTADPEHPTLKPVPYTGVQFVGIPEFQSFGTVVGQSISGAIAGQMTVDQALAAGNATADRAVKQAGYQK